MEGEQTVGQNKKNTQEPDMNHKENQKLKDSVERLEKKITTEKRFMRQAAVQYFPLDCRGWEKTETSSGNRV